MITENQNTHASLIDEIRDKFNPYTPKGIAYINSFSEHNHELIKIFSTKPEILIMWDNLINEFDTNEISTGKVSTETIDKMKAILDEVKQLASSNLKLAIEKHKFEIDYFPNTMAFMLFSFYFF